jgi:hypothetical protein
MSFSDAVSLVLHITPLDGGGYCDEASASSDAVTIRWQRRHWRREPETGWIGAKEQITKRPAQQIGDPSPGQMVRVIVHQVAALAQALKIAPPVIGRI